jgi:hypothetical protein
MNMKTAITALESYARSLALLHNSTDSEEKRNGFLWREPEKAI